MRDVLGPFEAAREYARALNQARKALDALVEIEEATRPGTKLDVQGRKEIHAIARRGVLAAQSLMSTSPGKDPGNIAPPVDSREPCVCRLTGGACAGASRPTALDAATVEECAKTVEAEAPGLLTPRAYTQLARRIRKLASAEPQASLESPPPAGPTGMKPGQRCTKHGDELHWRHEYEPSTAARWALQSSIGRCEYVEPPAGPVCASYCGEHFTQHAHGIGEVHPPGSGPDGIAYLDGACWCSTACKAAGRPLHPEVPTTAFFTKDDKPTCPECKSIMIPHGDNRLKCVNCGATSEVPHGT